MTYRRQSSASQGEHLCWVVGVILVACLWSFFLKVVIGIVVVIFLLYIGGELYEGSVLK